MDTETGTINNFTDFRLNEALTDGLTSMGFKQPTPVQQKAIPEILRDHDLIACAQTGTGKTAAYLLPVMHKIMQSDTGHINTLILAPTRELAQQIDQQVEGLSYFTSVSSIAVYGGGDAVVWDQQKKAMTNGTDIIIATPGRLLSMLNAGSINFNHLQHLILDEADRMLDMGFYEDIIRIISFLPKKRQTLLFSATMPPKIRSLAERILNNPREVNIAISKPAEKIIQLAYMVYDNQKEKLLKHILADEKYTSIIIFVSTKELVKKLSYTLHRSNYPVKAFHSDLEQPEREEIIRAFRNRQLRILVGTDVLSRGIDIDGISLVLNYDSPWDPEDYVHRIGRTARADADGTAITFITENDQHKFGRIEKLIGKEVTKVPVPESLGPGPVYNPLEKKKSNKPFRKKKWHPKK
ncbi:MAG: DEAD/DEAH box helicase [Bacteroidota bacterium]